MKDSLNFGIKFEIALIRNIKDNLHKKHLTFFNIKRIMELLVLRLTGINFEQELSRHYKKKN